MSDKDVATKIAERIMEPHWKDTRSMDYWQELERERAIIREELAKSSCSRCKSLEDALRAYAECSDGCTCGDGWDHKIALEALGKKESDK